jgi:CheY-like chemotaxis protein
LRVLQVEDNETNRTVIERVLSRVGHSVSNVENGAEALEAIKSKYFDVILMDRHMPVMDGIEATRRIRQMDGPIASIPIIGITASASQDELQACIDAGMDDCLIKPVEAVKLRALLERLSGGDPAPTPDPVVGAEDAVATGPDQLPVDLAGLARIIGEDDRGELFSMLDIFNNEFPKLLASLEAAIRERDAEAVHICAHTAKGAAANAAALSLSAMLKEIQFDAHLQNWGEIEARTDAVKSEYGRVVDFCDDRKQGAGLR